MRACWRCVGLLGLTNGLDLDGPHSRSFWGRRVIGAIPDHRHHGEGEHDKRDVAMPAMPRPAFVMVEAKLVLGGLEAVFNGPAMTFDGNEGVDARAGRTDTMS